MTKHCVDIVNNIAYVAKCTLVSNSPEILIGSSLSLIWIFKRLHYIAQAGHCV